MPDFSADAGIGADFYRNYNIADTAQPQAPSLLDMVGGAGGNMASLIAKPPEGWQSQTANFDQAGVGNGWLWNNSFENEPSRAFTNQHPMPYGINPFTDIVYNPDQYGREGQTSGFQLNASGAGKNYADLGAAGGQDLFGGRQFQGGNLPRQIPEQLQPWLAPALMRYFYNQNYANQGGSGINAPWTGRYAPRAPDIKTWPGITKYDPWGRSMGEIPNYSGG